METTIHTPPKKLQQQLNIGLILGFIALVLTYVAFFR